MTRRRLARFAAGSGVPLASHDAWAYTATSNGWNMPTGVTQIAHSVHSLHMWVFLTCVAIGVVVFGVMLYSIINHRRSKHPNPANFHENVKVEIAWTIAPFVILICLAVPAAGTLIKMEDTRNSDLTVKVTGYQWKWQYEYVGQGVSFFSTLSHASNAARQLGAHGEGLSGSFSSADLKQLEQADGGHYLVNVDNPLYLPVGKKIRFLITSNDVIHAWWVPDFAVKKDAIPGYINEVWTKIDEPGVYRGVCAELCGRDHGFMPIVVHAVPEDEFEAFLKRQKDGDLEAQVPSAETVVGGAAPKAEPAVATTEVAAADTADSAAAAPPPPAKKALSEADLLAKGKTVYEANCQACHQANGQGMPPNFPALAGSTVANGPPEAHIEQILKGKKLMPPFAQLSDEEIAAVATFERTSWGNKGSVIQPDQVSALRQ
nr:cytochrome c oxidase subunit II [Solimonas marina]